VGLLLQEISLKSKLDSGSWQFSIIQLVAWLISMVLAVVCVLYIREVLIIIASLFQLASEAAYKQAGNPGIDLTPGRVVLLFDNIMLFVLGVSAVGFVIWVDYYFRRGRPEGLLLKRIGIVLGSEVAIIVACVLIKLIA
jgi:hypothetical protein